MTQQMLGVEAWLLPGATRFRNSWSKWELSADHLEPGERLLVWEALLHGGCEVAAFRADRLAHSGLLLDEQQRERAIACDAPLAPLRFATEYWDYSDPSALTRDADDMLEYRRQGQPEPRFTDADTALDGPGFSSASTALIGLAHLIFDARGTQAFHDETVAKKLVPSIGARHGLNAYVREEGAGKNRQVWVAVKADGTHITTRAGTPPHRGASAVEHAADPHSEVAAQLVICADFERYQWRYRTGWIYQCVYLDLGHVCAALKLLAKESGVTLRFMHPSPSLMGAGRELVNEPLLAVSAEWVGAPVDERKCA